MIDTHTHIYLDQFNEDGEEMYSRAIGAGLEKLLMPNIDQSTHEAMMGWSRRYPDVCKPMMGLHPCSVGHQYVKELDFVEAELNTGNYIGVGETGLDYYWDTSFKEQQKEALMKQLEWAKKYKLPIVLHTRDSFEDAFQLVEQAQDGHLKGVFHCFSGSAEDLKKVRSIGFCAGIGGVVTFKNGGLDQVLANGGLDNLILETDAPYLAPAPHRGKRNEPAYIRLVAERLAAVVGESFEETVKITSFNARQTFDI